MIEALVFSYLRSSHFGEEVSRPGTAAHVSLEGRVMANQKPSISICHTETSVGAFGGDLSEPPPRFGREKGVLRNIRDQLSLP